MSTIKKINEDLKELAGGVHKLRNRVQIVENSKVDKSQFQWILGLLMTVVIGLLGAMFFLIIQTSRDVRETSGDVSYIYGFIETLQKNYEINIQE